VPLESDLCTLGSHEHHQHHLHGHAPIGVMGDHIHQAGEWMVSYRYMFMRMDENHDGTRSLSDAEVLDRGYMVAPTDMDMQMHMIGLMYAPTDRLTLMGMINYVDLSMNHVRSDMAVMNMGGPKRFKTTSSGLGDTSLTALFKLTEHSDRILHAGLGLLFPSAGVTESDQIPGPGTTRLPYPMQLGSGSWGLAPSLTYNSLHGLWSWGAQARGTVYLDDNSEGYRLGNRGELTLWSSRQICDWASLSLRTTASTWGNIHGSDKDLLPLPVPTADPDLRGGSRLDVSLGLNLFDPTHAFQFGAEIGAPVWQDLDGPQLGTEWFLLLGAQYSW
jgi:hypothetical protein